MQLPHGIPTFAGPGKVVVVAAGNPGANNWSSKLSWGFALHGSGQLNQDAITFRFPPYSPGPETHVFFDLWHPTGNNKCRVRIRTPNNNLYPATTTGSNKNTWVTGSSS